ncbi:DnaB-like helicase C-terminal domain-containing protein [Pseudodesulfovibrio thermohalotolerans]|nr:DnaB-like helicase C-terminal domain-containing protein [Pseudodesulfovibrio thermohalotolerans]WFS63392.1 DnaB-like helicase C-terminal domain-containing protein [Pseudodesulfovibrio thermohalotolerans]
MGDFTAPFLFRQAVYASYYMIGDDPYKNHAEIILVKHRCGPTGRCELFFDHECGRFDNITADPFVE